ncbi:MAG: elongation factor G [Candidatus Omnitrophota bacterium]|nr:elongation factor G [Candidatus Omnitrophota bacterium]MBU1894512.1 elongation factor G [Candidatus Omnitrophota bacterium]
MTVSTKNIRNIVLLSHSGAGKTTLTENLLFKTGAISKKGSVSAGTTVSDYCDDEKERKTSINLSVAYYERDGIKVNILDAPGYLDYIGDVVAGINAADSAILLIDAVSGIEVGASKFWKLVQERNMPGMIVINKMDKDNANFAKTLESVRKRFGKNCVALYYPNGSGAVFSGMANLLTKQGIDKLDGQDKDIADMLSNEMVEGVAESDDALLEKYLEEGALSPEEMNRAFRKGVDTGKIIPVVPASVEKGIGIDEIIEMINKYMPSPEDLPPIEIDPDIASETAEIIKIEPKSDGPFSAQVFKTISDPYKGQISIFRVRSGKAVSNQMVQNSSKSSPEKFGQLFFLKGKDQIQTDLANAGDVVCAAKLKDTDTGDSLSEDKKPVKFKNIKFPEPAISFSIKPKSRSDEDKISGVLVKLMAEDPTFKMVLDKQTHELVISGMGDMHLKTIVNRMKDRYGVEVEIGTPKVAYKETISGNGDSKYRHKKQSGGAGQFAEVWLRVEPLERGAGFEFVDEVVGGAIPKQFVGSCEKGVKNAMADGTVAGYPLIDVKATVYDGKTHPVDSKDIAFQIAAAHAFREACAKAKPVLLEPIMNVELTVPEENMGDITGSLSSRRGRVQGMDSEGGLQLLRAQIPLEEMYKYANELKSLTAGRATYTMSFSHYEAVPSNVAQKIIAESKKAKEEAHSH